MAPILRLLTVGNTELMSGMEERQQSRLLAESDGTQLRPIADVGDATRIAEACPTHQCRRQASD